MLTRLPTDRAIIMEIIIPDFLKEVTIQKNVKLIELRNKSQQSYMVKSLLVFEA